MTFRCLVQNSNMKNLFIGACLFITIGCSKNQHLETNTDNAYEMELCDLSFYTDTVEVNLTDPNFIE